MHIPWLSWTVHKKPLLLGVSSMDRLLTPVLFDAWFHILNFYRVNPLQFVERLFTSGTYLLSTTPVPNQNTFCILTILSPSIQKTSWALPGKSIDSVQRFLSVTKYFLFGFSKDSVLVVCRFRYLKECLDCFSFPLTKRCFLIFFLILALILFLLVLLYQL